MADAASSFVLVELPVGFQYQEVDPEEDAFLSMAVEARDFESLYELFSEDHIYESRRPVSGPLDSSVGRRAMFQSWEGLLDLFPFWERKVRMRIRSRDQIEVQVMDVRPHDGNGNETRVTMVTRSAAGIATHATDFDFEVDPSLVEAEVHRLAML